MSINDLHLNFISYSSLYLCHSKLKLIWLFTSNPIFDSEATKFHLRRQKMEENTVVVVSLSYTLELLTLPWFKKGII